MKFYSKKNQLDEMQEAKLRQIEANSFWLLWTLLVAVILVQAVMTPEWRILCGEFIAFMVVNVYLVTACLRAGLYDRHFRPGMRTNLVFSAVAGAATAGCALVAALLHHPEAVTLPLGLAILAGTFFATFAVCFAMLWFFTGVYKRRRDELEREEKE